MPKYPRVALFLPFAVLLLGVYVLGQSEAQQLARSVVQNEWNARQEGSPTPWTYLLHTDESGKKEILDVVHCVDGPVYRVWRIPPFKFPAESEISSRLSHCPPHSCIEGNHAC